ncbi:MAG: hypothetical protein HOK71_00250 [Planctomycetaceae bacterium]|jgi:hypothetical protein|nr:hypothetical protein [Planctomycetaceae bacterium]MBT6483083.1 hypothetical protein [Planctomycetaceae bacterium]
MNVATMTHEAEQNAGNIENPRQMLWIDSVGSFLLCQGEKTTIGGPQGSSESADLSLLANLSRKHATLIRSGDGYLLEAHAAVQVSGRSVNGRINLSSGCEILLGENVRLKFQLPSALSATATIEFLSDHRPDRSVNGVILMDETCLLGPGRENHVRCPGWPESVLLFRRGGSLWCKSRAEICIDNEPALEPRELHAGSVVAGVDMRFRIEPVGE